MKHAAVYLCRITNIPKTIWAIPQLVCTALYCPDLLTLIRPVVCREVLTKTIILAHIVRNADVPSATVICHAACGMRCYVVAWLEGCIEKGGAVAAVTVAVFGRSL